MLTNLAVKNLQPRESTYEHMDKDAPGFGVRVRPSGTKTFIYRYRINNKLRRITIGQHQSITLKEARKRYEEEKAKQRNGIDPLAEKAEKKRQDQQQLTCSALADIYLEKHAANKRTGNEDRRILQHDVLPFLGNIKVKDICRQDVIDMLERIIDRGATTQANRTLACVRKMFNFAINKGRIENSPCSGITAPSKENTRDRVLDDGEIKSFWNLAGLSYDTAMALKLQLLLAQRIGEIVGMMWSEVDFSENLWTIPKDRVKNKTVHTVPLNRTAVALLQDRRPSNAAPSDFVFLSKKPGKHISKKPGKHIRTDSIGTALARALKNTDIEHFSSHDLRRTAATRISGLGVSREVLRQILNHKDLDVTGRYDRYKYDSEKRLALKKWDDQLQGII